MKVRGGFSAGKASLASGPILSNARAAPVFKERSSFFRFSIRKGTALLASERMSPMAPMALTRTPRLLSFLTSSMKFGNAALASGPILPRAKMVFNRVRACAALRLPRRIGTASLAAGPNWASIMAASAWAFSSLSLSTAISAGMSVLASGFASSCNSRSAAAARALTAELGSLSASPSARMAFFSPSAVRARARAASSRTSGS